MATAAPTPKYEPDAEYLFRVSRPLHMGSFRYLPRDEYKAKGAFLTKIEAEHGANAISSAKLG
jgi:hypothetical protein